LTGEEANLTARPALGDGVLKRYTMAVDLLIKYVENVDAW